MEKLISKPKFHFSIFYVLTLNFVLYTLNVLQTGGDLMVSGSIGHFTVVC